YSEAAWVLGNETQHAGVAALQAAQVYATRWHQGRLDEAEAEVRALLAEAAHQEREMTALHLPVSPFSPDEDADLVEVMQALPKDGAWLEAMTMLAEAAARRDDAAAAVAAYELLVPYRDQFASAGNLVRGPVAHYLGLVQMTLGNHNLAEEHFAEAAEVNERLRTPFFAARTRVAWARLLLARRRGGDVERAKDLL